MVAGEVICGARIAAPPVRAPAAIQLQPTGWHGSDSFRRRGYVDSQQFFAPPLPSPAIDGKRETLRAITPPSANAAHAPASLLASMSNRILLLAMSRALWIILHCHTPRCNRYLHTHASFRRNQLFHRATPEMSIVRPHIPRDIEYFN